MNIVFKASFRKDLKSLKNDSKLFSRIKELLLLVETTPSIDLIGNVKKLKSEGPYYRIRIGDYRLGVIIDNDIVTFVRILHRSKIYRYFP